MQPGSARRADCRELRRAAIASLPQSTLLERHPRPHRSHEISAPPARAPVASVLVTNRRSEDRMIVPANPRLALSVSKSQIVVAAEHLPYFNRHIRRFPAWPGSGGCTGSNLVRLLGTLYVNNPVSGKELLRFREHAVRNRLSVTPRANNLSVVRQGQPLRVH